MKSHRGGRDLFRVNAITAGCLALLVVTGASAQEKAQQLDTVVVTGIRKGIEDAISVKKNKDNIVEAISAEDIGKLPDASVADSIARLPGLTAQRTAGRAQQISIRGMAPDFSTALLNGREQVTTGDSRGVEFDQYPSELLSTVLVYKTPDAALIGQGLSGTIDLQTARPLNFKNREFAVNARRQQTGVGLGGDREGTGNRYSAFYVDQFLDRTLGVALGWARFNEDGAKTGRFEGWGVADTCPNNNFVTGTTDCAVATVKTPGGLNSWIDQTVQTRSGAVAVLQFKPSKSFETNLDLFFSKFEKDKRTKGFQAPIGFSENGNYDPAGKLTTFTGTTVATTGTFDNFKGVVRNDTEATDDKMRSIGWNTKFTGDVWTTVLDISASNAKRSGAIFETTAGLPGPKAGLVEAANTISWTGFDGNNVNSGTYKTSVNYGDPTAIGLTDVQGWGGGAATPQAGYSKLPNVEDDLKGLRLSTSRSLPEGLFFSSVDLGFNESRREKTRAYIEGRLTIGTTDPYAVAPIPGGTTFDAGGFPIVSWDPQGSIGPVYTIAKKLVADIVNKDWTVKEKVTTAYVKANLDSEVAGMSLRGNVGLQLVNTKQDSLAFNVDGSACPGDVCATRPNVGGKNYHDFLPSMNLSLDLGNDQVLRLGAARVLARPTLSDMRASLGFGVDRGTAGVEFLKGSAGNPELKPFRANAFDISYEKYFGTKGYFSAAAFHKKLTSYILKQNVPFDFAPFVNATTPLPAVGPFAGSTVGLLEVPLNGTGGNIKGVELAASVPFSMLWQPLDGFGVQASYANTSSSVSLASGGFSGDGLTGTIPLPGLSKQVSSLQLYFEKWGFQARVNRRHRSSFLGEVSDFTGDRRLTYVKAEALTDAQIGYEFQSGPVKGLSILLQGYNLGNQEFVRFAYKADGSVDEKERTKYGKTYLLGLNYKL